MQIEYDLLVTTSSPELSQSRPNLYDRIRRSLTGVEESQAWKEATVELAVQALDARDAEIASHCARVAELAARLAAQLDLGRRNVELIRTAPLVRWDEMMLARAQRKPSAHGETLPKEP